MATYELPYDDSVDEEEVIIAELDSRSPDTNIQTCADFGQLDVDCCKSCHTFYPEYEMSVIPLPDGGTGWVCDPVKDAVNGTISKSCSNRTFYLIPTPAPYK